MRDSDYELLLTKSCVRARTRPRNTLIMSRLRSRSRSQSRSQSQNLNQIRFTSLQWACVAFSCTTYMLYAGTCTCALKNILHSMHEYNACMHTNEVIQTNARISYIICIHACIHIHIQTNARISYIQYVHSFMHTYAHTNKCTCIIHALYAFMHAYICTYKHMHVYHTYITCIHACIHTNHMALYLDGNSMGLKTTATL